MGSGRKRPLERGSPNPMKGDVESRKKKKGKKIKERKESISTTTEPTNNSPMESTATAEGKIMSQVMSTFNRLEQSRFEAFRRAGFPADAISKFVAHCLIDEHGQSGRRAPVLSELVAPGQAEEICIVVSTLAKAYAQRLVTAARRLPTTTSSNEPLTPDQIMAAFRDRQTKGLDPGFFLQGASSSTTNRTVLQNESYQRKRLAALKAQDDYDKMFPRPPTPTSTTDTVEEDNETNDMDISADYGSV